MERPEDPENQSEQIDWEDLESRLYSQVYHSAPTEEDFMPSNGTMSSNTETTGNRRTYRYFEVNSRAPNRPQQTTSPSFISLNKTTQIPDNVRISTSVSNGGPETRTSTHVHNNITVNQYTIPPLLLQTDTIQSPWQGNVGVVERTKARRKRNRKKKKSQRNSERGQNPERFPNDDTILVVSDVSDDECVIVDEVDTKNAIVKLPTGFPKKYDEAEGGKKPEDDDEIIYIPPAPVEVINIDLEETEPEQEKTVVESTVNNKQSKEGASNVDLSSSNDFLDNISLTEFDSNNQQDFVRPPNPIEYCETESSESTNDIQSRNFCNTVNTIVFDEVAFPRDDIFSDNNLESFGSFITPKRNSKPVEASPAATVVEDAQPEPVETNNTSSDGSSSESDYEQMANRLLNDKSLPDLCPMMTGSAEEIPSFFHSSTPKPKKIEKSEVKKKQRRKKLAVVDESVKEVEEQESLGKVRKRKKKKQSSTEDDASSKETPCKAKPKKQKSLLDDETLKENIATTSGKPRKNKRSLSMEDPQCTVNDDLNYQTVDDIDQSVLPPTPVSQNTTSVVEEPPDNLPQFRELNVSGLIVVDETTDDVGDDMELANCSTSIESRNREVAAGSTTAGCPPCSIDFTSDYLNFNVETVQRGQSDDPEKWQISHRDRALYLNMDRSRGPRCNRCKQFGHIAVKCKEKPNAPSCTLCGEPDHQEPRCPNKRCTQCGNRGNFSTTYCWKCFKFRHVFCKLCKMRGHVENCCPDIWRRYHATTLEGPIVTSQFPSLTRDKRWCSGCARQGHLEHECDYYNRPYPPTTPFVVHYGDNLAHPNVPRLSASLNQTPDSSLTQPPVEFLPPLIPDQCQVPNPFALTPFAGSVVRGTSDACSVSRNFPFPKTHVVGGTEIDLTDLGKIKHLVMSGPANVVHEFISKEIDQLYNNVANCDLKLLRKKLFMYDKVLMANSRQSKMIRLWYRIFNMAVFGLHGLQNGRKNSNILRNFVDEAKFTNLNTEKRRALFSAYSYIFGCDKRNLNYHKILQLMIQGKLKKFS